jgi:radical SAM superfamily enzyme YgiQ (UPF0313 family)
MLYLRFFDRVERERHLPLGPLYLTRALEDAGYEVDFRDYQLTTSPDPFLVESCADFLADSAVILGFSVMANLLPFAILVSGEIKRRHPEKTIILGGVGSRAAETEILKRFPAIDIIAYGEGERAAPVLLDHLMAHKDLAECPNILYRDDKLVVKNPPLPRISDLDSIPYPAYDRTDLPEYDGLGMLSSRDCPYRCSFCSVTPIWDFQETLRSSESIISEIAYLKDRASTDLFLFQDEYFLSSPERAKDFSRKLISSALNVSWKAFGRINLIDREAMELMARAGCVEIRFGVESGSDEILRRVAKGFDTQKAIRVVSEASEVFPAVDTFFIWGFPFETMEQFYQSLFLMQSFRMMGARVLPSLLCYLPQTRIYRELDKSRLEFSYEAMPEYMVTGHEMMEGCHFQTDERYSYIYDFIIANKDIFPGFFHHDVEGNIRPKLQALMDLGFYSKGEQDTESCGAHSCKRRRR